MTACTSTRSEGILKVISLMLWVVAAIFAAPIGACAQQTMVCDAPNQCRQVQYAEAVKYRSNLLPPKAEAAYQHSYGQIELKLKTTAGFNEQVSCGGVLVSREKRLVIGSQHCLPPYETQLTGGAITFRGVPAEYVASLAEADLALLHLTQEVPQSMQAVPYKEAVVQSAVYGRSEQLDLIGDQTPVHRSLPDAIFFMGPVSFYGTITAKGRSGIARGAFKETVVATPYQLLRIQGEIEPGFSGSPLFNQDGEVVGIISSAGAPGVVYASSAANFPALLAKYVPKG